MLHRKLTLEFDLADEGESSGYVVVKALRQYADTVGSGPGCEGETGEIKVGLTTVTWHMEFPK